MKTLIRGLYPARCLVCGDIVSSDFGLCGACWAEMPFQEGLTCNSCGAPLIGSSFDSEEICDACLRHPKPWGRGRAALLYQGSARRLIMGLKHSDRTDIARPAAGWLLNVCQDIIHKDTIIISIPLHWRRLLRENIIKRAFWHTLSVSYPRPTISHGPSKGMCTPQNWISTPLRNAKR